MYKWKLVFILNSGKVLEAMYKGEESYSSDVAEKVLSGDLNSFSGYAGEDETHNLYVKTGDISALDISIWKEDKERENNG